MSRDVGFADEASNGAHVVTSRNHSVNQASAFQQVLGYPDTSRANIEEAYCREKAFILLIRAAAVDGDMDGSSVSIYPDGFWEQCSQMCRIVPKVVENDGAV